MLPFRCYKFGAKIRKLFHTLRIDTKKSGERPYSASVTPLNKGRWVLTTTIELELEQPLLYLW